MVHPIAKQIVPPLCRIWLRKASGLENIPKNDTFIAAANHSSYYETLLLPSIIVSVLNKKIHALVNSYYWSKPLTRFFLNIWEQIPVFVEKEKGSKEKNNRAFEKAVSYLNKNELVMVFPEGRRNYEGKLGKGYNGVAILALKSKKPVLPIGVIDSHKVLPKGAILPRFARCEVKIGKPMYFNYHYNKTITQKNLGIITRRIMKEIAKLIGQKYNY